MTDHRTTVRNGPWTAVYHGGAYIDVHWGGRAIDCINVWDYATDTPTIPNTRGAVRAELADWVAESADDYLRNVVPYL